MHWTDEAIILSLRKHGENSAVLRVFARQHGVAAGVINGAHSKANRGVIQPGNRVNIHWQARLAEHLGSFRAELLEANAALMMQDASRLAALSSACALIESSMPERHPYPNLYQEFLALLNELRNGDDWLREYIRFELTLLAESGFGLDLSRCAATGKTEGLIYVSPKSGRAVSREAGEPYKDKLLPLPPFLLPKTQKKCVEGAEILAGLHLTGYFLAAWLAEPHGKKLLAARQRLIHRIKETVEDYGAKNTA